MTHERAALLRPGELVVDSLAGSKWNGSVCTVCEVDLQHGHALVDHPCSGPVWLGIERLEPVE